MPIYFSFNHHHPCSVDRHVLMNRYGLILSRMLWGELHLPGLRRQGMPRWPRWDESSCLPRIRYIASPCVRSWALLSPMGGMRSNAYLPNFSAARNKYQDRSLEQRFLCLAFFLFGFLFGFRVFLRFFFKIFQLYGAVL